MIEIKNLTLQRGLKILLDKANATVNPGQRVGLIGKNGTGKSSLFALIKGEITQDGGDISIPKNWRIASVSQETPDLDISSLNYVLQGDAELQSFQTALCKPPPPFALWCINFCTRCVESYGSFCTISDSRR